MYEIDSDQSGVLLRMKRKTTPRPIFGMSDQFSFYGIQVHELKFFYELGLAPDVEIVKAVLPELGQRVVPRWKRKHKLK